VLKEIGLKILNITLSFSLVFNTFLINTSNANVSHVTPDGSTNTTIDISPNNISIVNIADPNSNGVSMNNFTDYNVDSSGIIINNSNVNYNTHLAGWISANTHISNGSNHQASLIVEQVTGNMPSYLLGYTEIAGGKADLVLLNPNGIACNGCGFININNMFLATGVASYQSGILSGINTNNNGSVSIGGLGLDGTSLNQLTLISKHINLNATTNLGTTGTFIIEQGTGTYDFLNQAFSHASTTGTEIAIDMSNLGSMYVGSAYLIVNDKGPGVMLNADIIAQQQGMTITTDGQLVYTKNLTAKTDINITTDTVIAQENSILLSQGNVNIVTNALTNKGYIDSFGNITLNNLTNTNGYIEALGSVSVTNNNFALNNTNGTIQSDNNNLTINSNYQFNNTNGQINSGRNILLNINANQNYSDTNSKINATGNLYLNSAGFNLTENSGVTIKATNFNNNSILFTQDTAQITATNTITNTSSIISRNNVIINATTLNNGSTTQAAYITADNDMQITANLNNIGHDIKALTEGNAYTVSNNGVSANLYVNSPPQITSKEVVTNLLTSTNSRITADRNLTITGNVLNQTGDILSGNNLTIIGNVTNNITHYTTRSLATTWTWRHVDCDVFCPVQWDSWASYYTATLSSLTPTRIAAANTLIIVGNKISNDSGNATFNNNSPLGSNIDPNTNNNYSSTFTNSSNLNTANLNSPNMELASLLNPAMFHNNLNPPNLTTTNVNGNTINFTYQTEVDPRFTNQNTFLSSAYFLSHLNFSPSRQIILEGDPTTERQLIHDTIAKAGMIQYLSDSSEDNLYQNGLTWIQNNQSPSPINYQFGSPLTQIQIDSLTTDMVIPIFQTINDQQVLVPQAYFCNATLQNNQQQNSTGGQIYSNVGTVNLIATGSNANISNSGYISSNNLTNIISQGNFTNTGGVMNSNQGDININANSVLITNSTDQNNQIQNVSKLTAGNGNIDITSTNDLNIQSAYIQALKNIMLTSTAGSVNLTQNSSTSQYQRALKGDGANATGNISNYNSQTVANVIQTGSADSSSLLIQKQQNNEKLAQLKIRQTNSDNTQSQTQDIQNQIDSLNTSNTQISQQLQQNANTGSITINSANQVNILASQNQTSNNYSFNASSFVGTTSNEEELKSATTVSPLLSSNDITINAGNNGDGNINLLSAILTGEGNLNLNGNVNMQSLQDSYYSYSHHELTSMNIGALIAELLAAAIIGALTAGAGAALMAGIGAASIGANLALSAVIAISEGLTVGVAVAGAVAGAVGVGLQLGITAAIDHKNGGAAASSAMQSGSGNQTIAEYNASNGGSLLFGGNINTTHNTNIDSAASIQSQNINQASQTNESASYESKHETIGPDWNQLMTDAAINGVVGGVTVAAGPLISAGIGKAANFITTGLNNMGLSSVVDGLAVATRTVGNFVDDVDDMTNSLSKSVDDLLGTGAKSASKAGSTLVNGVDDLGKNASKVDDVVNVGNKADDAIKNSDELAQVNKTADNIIATNKADDVTSNANKLDDTANNASKADDVAKKPDNASNAPTEEVKPSEYGTTAQEQRLKDASKEKMALADDINDKIGKLDLSTEQGMKDLKTLKDNWVKAMEGSDEFVYLDSVGKKTVGNGFNMDQVGAKQQWDNAFLDYDGIKPNFDAVYNGAKMEKDQISHLFNKSTQSRQTQLINKIGKENWSKLKPNQQMALESTYYNSPALVGDDLTRYIKNYAKSGSADDLAKAVKELQSNGGRGYSQRYLQPRRDGEAALLNG